MTGERNQDWTVFGDTRWQLYLCRIKALQAGEKLQTMTVLHLHRSTKENPLRLDTWCRPEVVRKLKAVDIIKQ